MERMQRAGWGEVGAEKGEEVEGSRGGSISSGGKGSFSEDSGYGETQEGEGGYLGQWSRLKKVVWGEGEGLQELGACVCRDCAERSADLSSQARRPPPSTLLRTIHIRTGASFGTAFSLRAQSFSPL